MIFYLQLTTDMIFSWYLWFMFYPFSIDSYRRSWHRRRVILWTPWRWRLMGAFVECSLRAANTKWLKTGVSHVFIQVILIIFAYLQLQLAWFLNPVVNRYIKLIHQLHWREGDQSTYVKKPVKKGGHTGIPWLAFIWEVENPIFAMLTTDHVLASK